jgi:hypothetical protein
MASKNSYAYYTRFLRCLRKYLEKKTSDKKEDKYIADDERDILTWVRSSEDRHGLKASDIYVAFEFLLDYLIEKSPSACMGADDWLDKFFTHAGDALCTGIWCGNTHCEHHNGEYPYNCAAENMPSKCKTWKAWRFQWRSYPEKEDCQQCRHYKPEKPYYPNDRACVASVEKQNQYKCYCRSKELPENCPKKKEQEKHG